MLLEILSLIVLWILSYVQRGTNFLIVLFVSNYVYGLVRAGLHSWEAFKAEKELQK